MSSLSEAAGAALQRSSVKDYVPIYQAPSNLQMSSGLAVSRQRLRAADERE